MTYLKYFRAISRRRKRRGARSRGGDTASDPRANVGSSPNYISPTQSGGDAHPDLPTGKYLLNNKEILYMHGATQRLHLLVNQRYSTR